MNTWFDSNVLVGVCKHLIFIHQSTIYPYNAKLRKMEGYQNPTLCAFLCIVQILVHCTLVCNAAVWIIEAHKTGQLYGPTKQMSNKENTILNIAWGSTLKLTYTWNKTWYSKFWKSKYICNVASTLSLFLVLWITALSLELIPHRLWKRGGV